MTPGRRRVPTWWAWPGLLLLCCSWAFATPVLGAPDEFAHVVRAAAVVRGQVVTEEVQRPGEYYEVLSAVDLPASYARARGVAGCYAFDPEVPASCAPPFAAQPGEGSATALTSVGRYPPLTYAVLGLPSLVLDGAAAVYGMRLVGALVCSSLLAAGTVALLGRRAHPALAVGTVLALTPMVMFLAGTVNPSGVEVAAGYALWAVALRSVLRPDPAWLRRDLLLAALAAAVLVNIRASSPVLAVLIVSVLALVAGRPWWRSALAGRRWVPAVVVGGVAGALATVWVVAVDPNGQLGGRPSPELADPAVAARAGLSATPQYLRQAIGVFGYLDPSAPLVVYGLWALLLLGLGVAALVAGLARERAALVLAAAVVVLLPVVVQVPTAADLGLIWQGRYLLAFAVGLPLLAGVVLARASATVPGAAGARGVVLAALVAQVLALVAALRRASSGTGEPLWALDGPWQPPLGWAGVIAVAVVGVVLLGAALWPGPRRPRRSEVPAADEVRTLDVADVASR